MHPLYTVAEIRDIEQRAAQRLPAGALMQRAGQAGANAALDLLPFSTSRARVLVLAGPGNNGGDALETAAHLAHAGAQVTLLHFDPASEPAPERVAALSRARNSAVHFTELTREQIAAADWNLIIDGLFGIGLRRPLRDAMAALVNTVNGLACPILALDVPSGLDADTGSVVGPEGAAIRATHTVTYIGDKPGLHTCDGRDYAGLVQVNDLDLDDSLFPPSRAHLNDVKLFSRHIRSRRHNSHKGSFGNVAVLGGATGMMGAPVLAGRTALMTGTGRVYLCFAGGALPYDSAQPELMCRAARDFDFDSAVTIAGPGLGSSADARELLALAVRSTQPLVLDADALNLMAEDAMLTADVARRSANTVLTPHPLEAARLLGSSVAEVQSHRLAAARTLAARCNATVLLKGSGTVLASASGEAVINNTGNPGLATAGTGDVLAGLCGSLLAQGWPGWEAALAAVWLHGMAADVLVTEGTGPIGLTASELVPAIRVALNRMVEHHGR
ncbi:NAD(P)H-hydrate dehydratase [Massilia endophytica]|uniref:NAD(P)H-hydrate dehydratase n=1 Tax=Massilia endophytica TaxID=2899220 RepID=UPI001E588EB4|nr:NAD(P)H-hydrate dehydratase [Massilia endophytica]UGQ48521.1 NAD(P)H-hydrate dehydratase [Massilia endophytica]